MVSVITSGPISYCFSFFAVHEIWLYTCHFCHCSLLLISQKSTSIKALYCSLTKWTKNYHGSYRFMIAGPCFYSIIMGVFLLRKFYIWVQQLFTIHLWQQSREIKNSKFNWLMGCQTIGLILILILDCTDLLWYIPLCSLLSCWIFKGHPLIGENGSKRKN